MTGYAYIFQNITYINNIQCKIMAVESV